MRNIETTSKREIFTKLDEANPLFTGLDDLSYKIIYDWKAEMNSPSYPDRNDYFLLVPKTVDFEGLIHKAEDERIPVHKVVKMLSLVANFTSYKKYTYAKNKYEWLTKNFTSLDSRRTKILFQNDFKKVYDFMKKEGILVRAPYGEKKSFSYGYHFLHRNQEFKIVKYNCNKLTQRIQFRFKDNRTKKYCTIFTNPFKRENFGINYDLAAKKLAEKYCDSFHQDGTGAFIIAAAPNRDEDEWEGIQTQNGAVIQYAAYHGAMVALVRFMNGEFYFNRPGEVEDKTKKLRIRSRVSKIRGIRTKKGKLIKLNESGNLKNTQAKTKLEKEYRVSRKTKEGRVTGKPKGRFYSSFTFLNKEVRELLCYGGEKLVQIDVKNCVAYLLSSYLSLSQYSFSSSMIELITTSKNYSYLASKLVKVILDNLGIKLTISDFRDVLKPLSEFELVVGSNIQQFHIAGEVNPCFFFQRAVAPDELCGISTLPIRNTLRISTTLTPTMETAAITTEKNIKFNSVSELTSLLKEMLNPVPTFNVGTNINQVEILLKPTSSKNSPKGKSFLKNKKPQKTLANFLFSLYMFPEILESTMNKELQRFQDLASSGRFYEHFISSFKSYYTDEEWEILFRKRFTTKYDNSAKHDRKLTKDMLTAMIYARNGSENYKQAAWAFIRKFPLIYALLYDLKKGDHKKLSNELFNLEAEIILDTIGTKLHKQKIPFFTVHDCIAVKNSDVEKTIAIINECFINKTGNAPKLEIE